MKTLGNAVETKVRGRLDQRSRAKRHDVGENGDPPRESGSKKSPWEKKKKILGRCNQRVFHLFNLVFYISWFKL
jgi:hypothetical protein